MKCSQSREPKGSRNTDVFNSRTAPHILFYKSKILLRPFRLTGKTNCLVFSGSKLPEYYWGAWQAALPSATLARIRKLQGGKIVARSGRIGLKTGNLRFQ